MKHVISDQEVNDLIAAVAWREENKILSKAHRGFERAMDMLSAVDAERLNAQEQGRYAKAIATLAVMSLFTSKAVNKYLRRSATQVELKAKLKHLIDISDLNELFQETPARRVLKKKPKK